MMTNFVSEKLRVNATNYTVYNFLGDFTNFENLMPEQVKNWKADSEHCTFTIDGLADLSMRIASRGEGKNIHIVAHGKNPIDYALDFFINPKDESSCSVELVLSADLNPFIKAVASKPLQNFVNILAQKLQQHFSN